MSRKLLFAALALAILYGVWLSLSSRPAPTPPAAHPTGAVSPTGAGGITPASAGTAGMAGASSRVDCAETRRYDVKLQSLAQGEGLPVPRAELDDQVLTLTPLLVPSARGTEIWRAELRGDVLHVQVDPTGKIAGLLQSGSTPKAGSVDRLKTLIAALQISSALVDVAFEREESDANGIVRVRYEPRADGKTAKRKMAYVGFAEGVGELDLKRSETLYSGRWGEALTLTTFEEIAVVAMGKTLATTRVSLELSPSAQYRVPPATAPTCREYATEAALIAALGLTAEPWTLAPDLESEARALRQQLAGKTLESLIQSLARPDAPTDERNVALAQLTTLIELEPARLQELSALLERHKKDEWVVAAIAEAAAQLRDGSGAKWLVRWLDAYHREPQILETLYSAIHTMPTPSAEIATALKKLFEIPPTPEARTGALLALGSVAKNANGPALKAETAAFTRRVLTDRPADLTLALEAVGNAGDGAAVEVLTKIIWEAQSQRDAQQAVEALRHVADTDVQPQLLKILATHPLDEAKRGAVNALTYQTLTDSTQDALMDGYALWPQDGTGELIRLATLRSLSESARSRAKPAVAKFLLTSRSRTDVGTPEGRALRDIYERYGKGLERVAAL